MNYTYSQNSVAGVVAFAVQLDDAFVLSNSTQDSVGKNRRRCFNRPKCKLILENKKTDTVLCTHQIQNNPPFYSNQYSLVI